MKYFLSLHTMEEHLLTCGKYLNNLSQHDGWHSMGCNNNNNKSIMKKISLYIHTKYVNLWYAEYCVLLDGGFEFIYFTLTPNFSKHLTPFS